GCVRALRESGRSVSTGQYVTERGGGTASEESTMWGYPGAQNKFNCIGAGTCRCKPHLPEVGWRQKRMRQGSVWDNEGRADPLEVAFHQEASPVLATTFPVPRNWQPPLRRCSPCSAKKQGRDVSD